MSDIHMQAGGSPPPGGVLTECGKIVWHPDELESVVPQARGPVTCRECLAVPSTIRVAISAVGGNPRRV